MDVIVMLCPPVGGDNPQALVGRLSPPQADKPWYNNFIQHNSVDPVQYEMCSC